MCLKLMENWEKKYITLTEEKQSVLAFVLKNEIFFVKIEEYTKNVEQISNDNNTLAWKWKIKKKDSYRKNWKKRFCEKLKVVFISRNKSKGIFKRHYSRKNWFNEFNSFIKLWSPKCHDQRFPDFFFQTFVYWD